MLAASSRRNDEEIGQPILSSALEMGRSRFLCRSSWTKGLGIDGVVASRI